MFAKMTVEKFSVSIQLIAPASGAEGFCYVSISPTENVSIQLIAPASGAPTVSCRIDSKIFCFHSTDCPSEWGHERHYHRHNSPMESFHSTDCPSEWGLTIVAIFPSHTRTKVSIQLIAPASGATKKWGMAIFPGGEEFPFN